jgi:hypothetical protein
MRDITRGVKLSFLTQILMYYSIPKLLSLLTFLFIINYLSYLKNLSYILIEFALLIKKI